MSTNAQTGCISAKAAKSVLTTRVTTAASVRESVGRRHRLGARTSTNVYATGNIVAAVHVASTHLDHSSVNVRLALLARAKSSVATEAAPTSTSVRLEITTVRQLFPTAKICRALSNVSVTLAMLGPGAATDA